MPSKLTRTTSDHDEIRRWAEERGGEPAEVERTERGGETGMIRLDFAGYSGAGSLKRISWDEWFQKFDEADLALVYQERTARGEESNFNKLVGRETAAARERGASRASRRTPRSGGSAKASRSRVGSGRRAGGAAGRGGGSRRRKTAHRSAARDTGNAGRGRGETRTLSGAAREAPRAAAARLTGSTRRSSGRSREGSSRSGTKSGRRTTSRTGRAPRGRRR